LPLAPAADAPAPLPLHDALPISGGSRTALPRQQTLRAAVEWSHHLLTPAEQVLFRRLSVFAGGWTLESAERVCADDDLRSPDVLDRKSTRLNSSHEWISYAVFCL